MSKLTTQYSWPVSPYSAKTRSYLQYKRIPFREKRPHLYTLTQTIQKAVGKAIMPTVQLADGSWLQDSSDIIDFFEHIYPNRNLLPSGPLQHFVAHLVEYHADEWLVASSLHYRWHIPANAAFAIDEFGQYGLPYSPKIMRKAVASRVAKSMQKYLPILGIQGEALAGVEKYTERLLAALDRHLSHSDFLLGSKPCIGDFALFGQLWAHHYRDPGSTYIFDSYPAVRRWILSLLTPHDIEGEFFEDDSIPETLHPLIQLIDSEHGAYTLRLLAAIDQWCAENPDAQRLPRALGETDSTIGGAKTTRKIITFAQYKLQRAYPSGVASPEVSKLLESLNAGNLRNIQINHPIKRENFKEVLA